MDTDRPSVKQPRTESYTERWARRPRYARDFVWADDAVSRTTLALATECMPALPRPPTDGDWVTIASETIQSNPHLFKIVTPINLSAFRGSLVSHPNRAFVESVLTELVHGFWPWAEVDQAIRPITYDNSHRPLRDPSHADFVSEQITIEVQLGCFSPPFGPDLLPGMYSFPIGVVPKPRSEKLRLVVDHSAKPHSLNGMIPRAAGDQKIPLDNLQDLGRVLRRIRREHGNECRLVVWKSDVSRAYRCLPMAFLWQILQIVTFDQNRHVDRCNNFGGRRSGDIFGAFMGLVLWIAIYVEMLTDMFAFADDAFSIELEGNLEWYEPYQKLMPAKQACFLRLWDRLGIPHEERKQLWGTTLTIIGFEVDPNAMTITMPPDRLADLISAIVAFAKVGQRRPLREFQQMAGWINWALNAYPLLRPSLSEIYQKMSGKSEPHMLVWVNKAMNRELTWFVKHVERSSGVHIMSSVEWDASEADLTLFTDACLKGWASGPLFMPSA